ncbi:hypothetical protein GCM10009679_66830 [Saccharothrix algeriensis]|uniref:Uncharacterized protein n=1 Tax=Catellatospora bangladeshensis TaxID=310355 RepID=A0A8J3JRZ6_9ACTN|nr:hypothetical protein Cba03nite_40780 [Catellatospora bangladeshensis]
MRTASAAAARESGWLLRPTPIQRRSCDSLSEICTVPPEMTLFKCADIPSIRYYGAYHRTPGSRPGPRQRMCRVPRMPEVPW